MRSLILGIGTALPAGSLTQEEAADAANALRRFDNGRSAEKRGKLTHGLYRRSAIRKRHSVLLSPGDGDAVLRQDFFAPTLDPESRGPGTAARMQRYAQNAPQLAAKACTDALLRSSCDASSIQHLVTVSCSGFSAPGFDLSLFDLLDLNPGISRTHVGFMGCHAALNGMRVANALSSCAAGEKALVCATELCTLHHQFSDDPQQMVANSLFADGAAAMVVQSADNLQTIGSHDWQIIQQASMRMPHSAEMMSWSIGDHGFEMTLSPQVPETIELHLKPWLNQWLEKNKLTIDTISNWAVHPGGPRILSATADALGIARERLSASDGVLAECGNMSSPTLLFILRRLADADATGPTVAIAFGPGLVVEAALLQR